jgi:hypothetical protein
MKRGRLFRSGRTPTSVGEWMYFYLHDLFLSIWDYFKSKTTRR